MLIPGERSGPRGSPDAAEGAGKRLLSRCSRIARASAARRTHSGQERGVRAPESIRERMALLSEDIRGRGSAGPFESVVPRMLPAGPETSSRRLPPRCAGQPQFRSRRRNFRPRPSPAMRRSARAEPRRFRWWSNSARAALRQRKDLCVPKEMRGMEQLRSACGEGSNASISCRAINAAPLRARGRIIPRDWGARSVSSSAPRAGKDPRSCSGVSLIRQLRSARGEGSFAGPS